MSNILTNRGGRGRITRSYLQEDGSPYVGYKVYVAQSGANNPATLYMDKTGPNLAGTNGLIYTLAAGEVTFWVADYATYNLQLRHPITDYVLSFESNVTPEDPQATKGVEFTPAEVDTLKSVASTGGSTGQPFIQFKDEGTDLGSQGTVTEIDFTGDGVTTTRVGNTLSVAITGGGSGSQSSVKPFLNVDAVSIKRGAPVYLSSPGQVRLAQGNLEGRHVIGIYAGVSDLTPGATGDFLIEGSLISSTAQWDVLTSMVNGLVRGKRYYLNLAFPGLLELAVDANTAPVSSYLVSVGYAISATELKLEIQPPIRLA